MSFGRKHNRRDSKVAPAVELLGAAANDQAGSGRCEATKQIGALHLPESKKDAKTEGAVTFEVGQVCVPAKLMSRYSSFLRLT
jgi:hypothetical protein